MPESTRPISELTGQAMIWTALVIVEIVVPLDTVQRALLVAWQVAMVWVLVFRNRTARGKAGAQ